MKRKIKIFDMVVCGLFSAICCVFSVITIPIGVVPVSLGILGVVFAGALLGPSKGFVSVLVYLLLGLFLPVFSGGQTGLSIYANITGGYVWSYLFVVIVVGLICKITTQNKWSSFFITVFACVVGMLICYTCGTAQFMVITGYNLKSSLTACVFPFVPFDVIKCIVVGVVAPLLKSPLCKLGYLK